MHVGLKFALRGAVCFGIGGAVAGLGLALGMGTAGGHAAALPMVLGFAFAGGVLAGGAFGYRQLLSMRPFLALTGFGAAFVIASALALAVLPGAMGGGMGGLVEAGLLLGMGWGLAGALGGASIRGDLTLPGFLMFALAGLVGGPLTIILMILCAQQFGLSGIHIGAALGLTLTATLGGLGFGAFVR